MQVDLVAPYPQQFQVTLGGVVVPYLNAIKHKDNRVSVILDHRFSVLVTEDQMPHMVYMLANALAVAAGKRSFKEWFPQAQI